MGLASPRMGVAARSSRPFPHLLPVPTAGKELKHQHALNFTFCGVPWSPRMRQRRLVPEKRRVSSLTRRAPPRCGCGPVGSAEVPAGEEEDSDEDGGSEAAAGAQVAIEAS